MYYLVIAIKTYNIHLIYFKPLECIIVFLLIYEVFPFFLKKKKLNFIILITLMF